MQVNTGQSANTDEKYDRCTSEEFKADVLELCNKCPLKDLIQSGIVNQIEFQARQKKEILTKEQFAEYIKGEIENASKAMEKLHLFELQNPNDNQFRGVRIRTFIWNKERIKALNRLLEEKIAFRNSKNIKLIEARFSNKEEKGDLLTFETEAAKKLVAILNPFFNEAHQTALETLLLKKNGVSELLLFKDNGNRLADAFKQLWEHSLIIGCQKTDLEKFIVNNFQYLYRGEVKTFTVNYAEKCISRNGNPCKNPLIKIEAGTVVKVETPKRRKSNNY